MAGPLYRTDRLGLGPANHPERIQNLEPVNSLSLSYEAQGRELSAYYPPRSEAAYDVVEELYNGTCIELLRNERPTINASKVMAVKERVDSYFSPGYTPPIMIPFEAAGFLAKLARDTINPLNPVTPSRFSAANRYGEIIKDSTYYIRGLLDSLVDVSGPTTRTVYEWAEDATERFNQFKSRDTWHEKVLNASDEEVTVKMRRAAAAAIRALTMGTARSVVGSIMDYHSTWTCIEEVGPHDISVAPYDVVCSVEKPDDTKDALSIHTFKPGRPAASSDDKYAMELEVSPDRIVRINLAAEIRKSDLDDFASNPFSYMAISEEHQAAMRSIKSEVGSLVLMRLKSANEA